MIKVAVSKKTGVKKRLTALLNFRPWLEKFRKQKKFRILTLAVIGALVILVFAAVFFIWKARQSPLPATDNQEVSDVINISTDNPSEIPPGPDFVWKGQPDDPKYIRLPSVGVEGYLQKVGVDQHSEIAVPNNVFFAGWFVNTSRPGDPGLSIIDGHLNGTSIGGIFRKLVDIAPGAEFEVEMGDSSIKKFRVMQVLTVDNEKAAGVLFSQEATVKSQLNLITCGGNYDKTAHHYTQRVIVTAEYLGNQ
jgi:hypothetical protein